MINWTLKKFEIKELKPYSKNPRTMTRSQRQHIKESLSKFGTAEKPIVNTDGTIIGGHQRVKILKEMGVKQIECWVPNIQLNDSEVSELCVRLNKNTGSFDYDILANEFELNELCEWGFHMDELLDSYEDPCDQPKEKKSKKISICPKCGETL